MASIQLIMILGILAGLLALLLISGDLSRRAGLAGPARLLLAAGLGTGVIALFIKLVLVGLLVETLETREPLPQAEGLPAEPSGRHYESVFVARWEPLPRTAPGGGSAGPETVSLGKKLFEDPRLSITGDIACQSCHKLTEGGDDNASVSTGIRGLTGNRNAPTVWNAAFLSKMFWDGRAASLEEQARGPLVNPVEMGMPSEAAVEARIAGIPEYRRRFARLFGPERGIRINDVAAAIASYERTLIAPDTRYDRFLRGEGPALTPVELRGMALFAGLGCRICHRDPTFSAAGLVNAAGTRRPFPIFAQAPYVKQYGLLADRGARRADAAVVPGLWRVPSLRNVANTAPYFHNGSVATLEEAIRVMLATQLGRSVAPAGEDVEFAPVWDAATRTLSPYRPDRVSERDVAALAAFLRTLSVPAAGPSGTAAAF